MTVSLPAIPPPELGVPTVNKPTFDEWFKLKNGLSFEAIYMQDGMLINDTMRALTRAMCDYVTELTR